MSALKYNQEARVMLNTIMIKYLGMMIKAIGMGHTINQTCINYMLKLFSYLTGEDYENINIFKKKIVNKRILHFPPSSKFIVKMIYKFVYVKEINGEKISVDEINEYCEKIKKNIMKLNRMSRLFLIRVYLCQKLDELAKIKAQCFSDGSYNIESAFKFIQEAISFVKTQLEISNLNDLDNRLDSLNKILSSLDGSYGTHKVAFFDNLRIFFSNLDSKFKEFIESLKNNDYSDEDKEKINTEIERILSYFRITKVYFRSDSEAAVVADAAKAIKSCVKDCKVMYRLTATVQQQLEDLENRRERKAYSFKSFRNFCDIMTKVIDNANQMLKDKGFDFEIKSEVLDSYKEMLERKDPKILGKDFFDNAVKEMKRSVYDAIDAARKESIFGKKKTGANKILDKISGLFDRKHKKALKDAFMREHINLTNASHEAIEKIIRAVVGDDDFEINKEEIEKILNHRDISDNLNYKNLFVKTINENTSAWKKIERSVLITGENSFEASISSAPVSNMGVFWGLDEGKGVASFDRDSNDLINAWQTKTQTKDGTVLFSGIRHANTRGKESSLQELILLAAVEQFGLEALQTGDSEKIWEVKIVNIQLMSPTKISALSPDKNMSFDQMEGFKRIYEHCNRNEKSHFTIWIKDKKGNPKKIKIKLLKPVLVNFGVNVQHFAAGGILTKSSYKQNKEAFVYLFGGSTIEDVEKKKIKLSATTKIDQSVLGEDSEVKKYLTKLDGEIKHVPDDSGNEKNDLELKRAAIINLASMLLFMWQSTNGRGNKIDPYAMPKLLAVLMYFIGYPVSFNCKSGKDRTGVLASEINYVVLYIYANNGKVPNPYEKLSEGGKLFLRKTDELSGSDDVAFANTGLTGRKVGYEYEKDRLGVIRGASKNANLRR